MTTKNPNARIVSLDVGAKRIGMASANVVARLATPMETLAVSESVIEDIKKILARETACQLVIGLPRGMQGQETQQTEAIKLFADQLAKRITVPISFQDETLTSVKSETELAKKGSYAKGDVDALAATYILEDYLSTHP